MKKIYFLFFFPVVLALNAQQLTRFDSLTLALEQNNKAMGSIAFARGGKIVDAKAFGWSLTNTTTPIKNNIETKFRIGSISKMFTAVMIFQLIEEKKLSRFDKLSDFFPEIPNAKKITIDHLLNHRSGLHNFTDDSTYLDILSLPKSQKEMISMCSKHKPDFEPDDHAAYSNTNYILLGYIIEKVSGHSYAEELKSRITEKLGLKNTYFGGKINPKNSEAVSYKYLTGKWATDTETDMSIPHGAGAIVSTPTELTQFISALFMGKLISDSSLKNMATFKQQYGRALFMFPFGERIALGHTGGIDGFSSMVGWFANDSSAIAFCFNGMNWNMNNVMIGALSIYFNVPYQIPTFKKFDVPAEKLVLYEGVYISKQVPLAITVKSNGKTITAQASGQSPFELEAISEAEFIYDAAGVKMIFKIEKDMVNQFILKQGGEFLFERKK